MHSQGCICTLGDAAAVGDGVEGAAERIVVRMDVNRVAILKITSQLTSSKDNRAQAGCESSFPTPPVSNSASADLSGHT